MVPRPPWRARLAATRSAPRQWSSCARTWLAPACATASTRRAGCGCASTTGSSTRPCGSRRSAPRSPAGSSGLPSPAACGSARGTPARPAG
eukprot:13782639-Alexandrium_andersonii.AAC.1